MQGKEVELGNLESKELADHGYDEFDAGDEAKPVGDGKSQEKSKIMLIVVLIVMALAVIGGVVVLILAPWKEEAEPLSGDYMDDLEGKSDEVVDEVEAINGITEVEKLDIDSALVQDLFNRFGGEVMVLGSGTDIYDLPFGAIVGDETMLGVVMQKMNDEARNTTNYGLDSCKVTHYYSDGHILVEKGVMSCFSGERVRLEARRIFGREIEIEPGQIRYSGDMWNYDEDADEIYLEGGLTGSGELYRALYGAEKVNNRVYLYEAVVMSHFLFVDSDERQQLRFSDQADVGLDVELTPENMVQYKDILDRYKWTFVDDGTGNYIFEGIERLED